jgi:hypothetical protein
MMSDMKAQTQAFPKPALRRLAARRMFVPVEGFGLVAPVLSGHAKKWEAIVKGCGARFCHLFDISRVKAQNHMELESEIQTPSEWIRIPAHSIVGLRVLPIFC